MCIKQYSELVCPAEWLALSPVELQAEAPVVEWAADPVPGRLLVFLILKMYLTYYTV